MFWRLLKQVQKLLELNLENYVQHISGIKSRCLQLAFDATPESITNDFLVLFDSSAWIHMGMSVYLNFVNVFLYQDISLIFFL